jgi:hypothetical protein
MMQGSRPSIFDNDVDLTPFKPKIDQEPTIPPETVQRIAAESGFPSRSPVSPQPPSPIRRPIKTGRTVLLNARVTRHAHDRFHAIVASEQARYEAGEIMHRPTLGEIVERALLALEREMKGEGA